MPNIQFYHLTKTPLESALPRLLEKAYAAEHRILVKVANVQTMEILDKALWTYASLAFLPHASDAHPKPETQPILLTTTLDNKNAANVLCITDDTQVPADATYDKIIDMFNGQDTEALKAARLRFKHYKDAGADLSYFQQTDSGWEKK